MSINCITFDLDDTLWAFAPVIARAEQRLYDWLMQYCPQVVQGRSGTQLMDAWFAFLDEVPGPRHDMTQLRRGWLSQLLVDKGYEPELAKAGFDVFWRARNEVDVFQDALDALDALKGRFRIGAITNGNADVHHIGIAHHFDFVITSAQVGVSKPDPAIFHAALAQARSPAAQVLHVGDDAMCDVVGAAGVGMRTAWVNAQGLSWEHTSVRPDAVIRGLAELEAVLEDLSARP